MADGPAGREGALRLSIALCTWNGERFLQAQLDSYLAQSRRPDELVVCDDGSSDATLPILTRFAQDSPFPVRIARNPERLGVVANFDKAIGLCQGDVIVLSDQDDVWHPGKLEQIASHLARGDDVAVFSDADVVDANLAPLGYTMWQRVGFDRREQARVAGGDPLSVLLKHAVVTGAALAFRSELRPLILPIPSEWAHDAWIALVAAADGRLALLPACLVHYRQHGANQVGGLRKPLPSQIGEALKVDRGSYYAGEIGRWRALHERLPAQSHEARSRVWDKLNHLQARANFPGPRWRRLPHVLRAMMSGNYARFARNWGSVALDLLGK